MGRDMVSQNRVPAIPIFGKLLIFPNPVERLDLALTKKSKPNGSNDLRKGPVIIFQLGVSRALLSPVIIYHDLKKGRDNQVIDLAPARIRSGFRGGE